MFHYLTSELGKELIDRWATGTTVKMIKMQDLKNIPIPIPNKEKQAEQLKKHQQILELIRKKRSIESDIEEATANFWS